MFRVGIIKKLSLEALCGDIYVMKLGFHMKGLEVFRWVVVGMVKRTRRGGGGS